MNTFPFVWKVTRFSGWIYLLDIALAMFGFVVIVILPGTALQQAFDALAGLDPSAAWWFAALYGALQLFYAVVWLANLVVDQWFSSRSQLLLCRNLLSTLIKRPAARALSVSPGEAVVRFREDVEYVSTFPSARGGILFVIAEPLFWIGVVVSMVRINAFLTLVGIVPVALVVLTTRLMTRRLQRYREQTLQASEAVTSAIGEVFGAVQAIQLAGAEDAAARHILSLNVRRRVSLVREAVAEAVMFAMYRNCTQIGTGLILLLAAGAIRDGSFTVGDFALFNYYLRFLTDILFDVGHGLAVYQQTAVSVERLAEFSGDAAAVVRHSNIYERGPLPDLPFVERTAGDDLNLLQARGLTYLYPESGRGVEDVDLELRRGDLLVITGRIGAGKTTLVRTLLGLLPADRGEIFWNDARVEDPSVFFVPPRCAYTPQSPRLFSETLRDNILLGLPEERVDLASALRDAVLEPDLVMLPEGLDSQVGPRGVRLSGGQVQRAAAARMLVRDASIYVFDDLSSALDVQTEQQLWDNLNDRPDRSIIAVSHRRAALERADKVLVLRDGQAEAFGTFAAVLAASAELRAILNEEE